MLYLRYVSLMLMLASLLLGGIYNTQTVIPTEKQKAEEQLDRVAENTTEEIDRYAESIRKNNQALKVSIEKIRAAIEIKKNTLVEILKIQNTTKNTKGVSR